MRMFDKGGSQGVHKGSSPSPCLLRLKHGIYSPVYALSGCSIHLPSLG